MQNQGNARPFRKERKKQKPQKRAAVSRQNPTILSQGVGAVPNRAFGGISRVGPGVWDATCPHHLSLPRPVGPYTTVRTTRRFTSGNNSLVFGTFMRPERANSFAGQWSTVCCVADTVNTSPIAASGNTTSFRTPLDFLAAGSSGATCVPSAFTVQIMNPEALQTTSGMVYAGVMHTQAKIGSRTETWEQYMERFVEYQAPRMLAAGKLALRGVRINSYPLSMSQVSEFTSLMDISDSVAHTMDGNFPEPTGWAPILVNNPGGIQLEYLVTTEWRVRFDLLNPASAGHVQHPLHGDNVWHSLMVNAAAAGNGVKDIADVVANAGNAFRAVKGAVHATFPMLESAGSLAAIL